MNWKYTVGKTFHATVHSLIRLPGAWRLPLPAKGYCMPFDILRYQRGQCPGAIIDAGANVGQTSLYLRRFFPRTRILAFEPVSATYHELRRNTSRYRTIEPIQTALGAQAGRIEVPLHSNSELNSLVAGIDESRDLSGQTETVEVQTLDQVVCDRAVGPIALLKSDTQGYDLEVLRGAEGTLAAGQVDFVYVEVNFDKNDKECTDFSAVNEFLEGHGFRLSGFYEFFHWGPRKVFFGFCNALFVNAKRFG
jgi:FkbM family methyltransferase